MKTKRNHLQQEQAVNAEIKRCRTRAKNQMKHHRNRRADIKPSASLTKRQRFTAWGPTVIGYLAAYEREDL
jgi:hypothetical protein